MCVREKLLVAVKIHYHCKSSALFMRDRDWLVSQTTTYSELMSYVVQRFPYKDRLDGGAQ